MSTKKSTSKAKAKTKAARYGIGEWFGKDLTAMSPDERERLGRLSYGQAFDVKKMPPEKQSSFWDREFGLEFLPEAMDVPLCPSLSNIAPNSTCNKSGGVCSMRRYEHQPDDAATVLAGDFPPTVCPLRFLEDGIVLRWVAEKMLGTRTPIVVKETPFLRKVSAMGEGENEGEDDANENKRAGRIDWILVDPSSVDADSLKWCALETQGVYFSGTKWDDEFKAYAKQPGKIHYPIGHRRPDYRSNGPKRLAPQLSVKVPVLRAWGTKVAVVVDEYFFNQMAELKPAFSKAKNDQDRLDNAEVIWFIVGYDQDMKMIPKSVHYSDLNKSVDALNATEPLERTLFQTSLKSMIKDATRAGTKIFTMPNE